jgi:hypothetical protein
MISYNSTSTVLQSASRRRFLKTYSGRTGEQSCKRLLNYLIQFHQHTACAFWMDESHFSSWQDLGSLIY